MTSSEKLISLYYYPLTDKNHGLCIVCFSLWRVVILSHVMQQMHYFVSSYLSNIGAYEVLFYDGIKKVVHRVNIKPESKVSLCTFYCSYTLICMLNIAFHVYSWLTDFVSHLIGKNAKERDKMSIQKQ